MQKITSFTIILATGIIILVTSSFVLFKSKNTSEPLNILRNSKVTRTLAMLGSDQINLQVSGEAGDSVEIILVGDVMLGRTVMGKAHEENDFSYPFRKVAGYLNDADIVFANLENPVIKDCPFTETSMIFCSTPEMLKGLSLAGIKVVNLANNHTGNYGNTGINETVVYLNGTNIDHTGLGELLIKEVNGISLGFLGFNYTYGVSAEMLRKNLELIKSSDSKVDHLIIGVHWGQEYMFEPNDFQKETAEKMIEVGADVVSGHHPHWIQTIESYKGKKIYYSLGNFVFDQMWSENTRTGLLAKLKFSKSDYSELETRKIYMYEWAQPELINEQVLNN